MVNLVILWSLGLRNFKPGTFLDHSVDEIPYTDFVNQELILFSMADNVRSIPSMVDGFKPGNVWSIQLYPLPSPLNYSLIIICTLLCSLM